MTLRVGLITSEFPPDIGGVETYAWQLATALGGRPGLQVTVYAPPKSASVAAPQNVTVKPILNSCVGLDWPKLKNEPIDVWHVLSAAHAWIAGKRAATVVSVHGNDFLVPYPPTVRPALAVAGLGRLRPWVWKTFVKQWRAATRRMLRRSLPDASAILANSRYTAEVLSRLHPACVGKIQVTHVGVDPRFFDVRRDHPNTVPHLLTVCRLSEPRKNVDLVLRALAGLQERFAFEYVIAGEGELRRDLEQLVDTLGLAARVRFTGPVDDRALRDLYAQADLFVLTASVIPASHEGFGIVYLEAAASGVPSLAARLAGAAEAVAENRSGFFVKAPDVASISEALARYLSGVMQFDAASCREFARGFSWACIADTAETTYRVAYTGDPK